MEVGILGPVLGISVLGAEGTLELSEALSGVFSIDIVSNVVVIDTSDDADGLVLWLHYLNERMLMLESFFAHLTVVKVLADAALVADASDGSDATTVTCYLGVLDYS